MTKKIFFMATLPLLVLGGCYNDILDPTQIGRFEPTPTVNVILDTLGVADEPSPTYEGAEEPRPEDLVSYEQDYVLGPGDIIRVSIFEMYQVGETYVNQYIVTETGRVSIPDVGIVNAEGLTEAKLEQEIADILSPNQIINPSVTVTLLQSQSRFFSIIGQGVAQPSRYEIPRSPIRLTDAIAYAGGIGDFNVTYLYVSRDVPRQDMTSPLEPGVIDRVEPDQKSLEEEMLEIITPSAHGKQQRGLLITSAEMATQQELESLAAPEGVDLPTEQTNGQPLDIQELLPKQQTTRIEWVFEDGKWKPVEIGGTGQGAADEPEPFDLQPIEPERREPAGDIPSDFGLGDLGSTDTVTRVIKIPRDRLESGDPRYNIIIRPGDRITVPRDVVGEFWIGGNVNAPNAYTLTGRPINLKQAIITAGGLNAIAQPKKVEVVRRLGKNKAGLTQEEIVMVDLAKIASGLQPDFFIKPNDQINVGTSGTSRWLAQLRNAFRATYGFGFIYDRNFATMDFDGDPFPGNFGFNSF